mmetsp:Transcript_10221/g.39940  ORF Transcript_10221/g.39940 Transcript_10221/m.39940 type:complete len:364 (+) Transcript_10221:1362-2453(+)
MVRESLRAAEDVRGAVGREHGARPRDPREFPRVRVRVRVLPRVRVLTRVRVRGVDAPVVVERGSRAPRRPRHVRQVEHLGSSGELAAVHVPVRHPHLPRALRPRAVPAPRDGFIARRGNRSPRVHHRLGVEDGGKVGEFAVLVDGIWGAPLGFLRPRFLGVVASAVQHPREHRRDAVRDARAVAAVRGARRRGGALRDRSLGEGGFVGKEPGFDRVVVLPGAVRGAGYERALARVVHPRGHHVPPVRVLHLDGGDVARHGLVRGRVAQSLVRVPGDLRCLVPESELAVPRIERVRARVLARTFRGLLVQRVEPPCGVLADRVGTRGRLVAEGAREVEPLWEWDVRHADGYVRPKARCVCLQAG